MKRAGVIGWPIAHSRSPLIHGYWLQKYGIVGSYTKEAVPPEAVDRFLAGLAGRGWVGCNVTVPHKEAALRAADVAEPTARAVGAANTLWLADGRLNAANTDTYGFMTYLQTQMRDWNARTAPACVLGAGGAARAIVYGLLEAGAPQVRIANRTRARAEQVARDFDPRVVVVDWSGRADAARGAGLVVNATSAGLKGGEGFDMDFSGAAPGAVAADIVYVPLETPFLAAARRQGLRTLDGLGMLLHQAVPGFEKWFGVRPEVTDELVRRVRQDIEAA
jgi:shikimate dehydrogenase